VVSDDQVLQICIRSLARIENGDARVVNGEWTDVKYSYHGVMCGWLARELLGQIASAMQRMQDEGSE
jgi:hypothetical protein